MTVRKVAIVSLSRGLLGESYTDHSLKLGVKRLKDMGLRIKFMPNALKGIDYLRDHPKSRANDLIEAFRDDSIDMILCAIGGDDTYRTLPYLFENHELQQVVNQKIFLGFSDTTINHFMLNKLGVNTFYGQAFLPDLCELSSSILPYTKQYFEELIIHGKISHIKPSNVWYKEREDFSRQSMGVTMPAYPNEGFEMLQGSGVFEGEILGGCLESIDTFFSNERYDDTTTLLERYNIFPSLKEWQGKILLLETSEEKIRPEEFAEKIRRLKAYGIFDVLNGVLFGKPQDEVFHEDYKNILLSEIPNKDLPIVCNINVGHATPRCIIPFGVPAKVDTHNQIIKFKY